MTDLDERLRGVDRLPVPEQWASIETRQARPSPHEPSRRRRVAIVALAAMLAAIPFVALWLAFRPSATTQTAGVSSSLIAFELIEHTPFLDGPGPDRPVASIFAVAPDGSGVRRLSPNDGAEYETFAWSPDGTQLAFDRFDQNDKSLHEGIYAMGADGSDLHEIYRSDQKPVSVQDLAWSPDGAQIAFVRTRYAESGSEADDRLDLFVMNADGSDLRQLTHGIQFTSVDWSPDGTNLLVTAQRLHADGERFVSDLALVNLDGEIVQELTHDGRSMEGTWSPDGTQIAFLRSDGPPGGSSASDVMGISARGGIPTALTQLGPGEHAVWPTWSPDGSKVAFSLFDYAQHTCSIAMTGASGAAPSELVDGTVLGGCPERLSWQPEASLLLPSQSDGRPAGTEPAVGDDFGGFHGLVLSAEALGTDDFTRSDFQGEAEIKVFWASWAGGVEEYLRALEQMDRRYGDRLAILGIDTTDDDADALHLLGFADITFVNLADTSGEIAEGFGVQTIPTAVIVEGASNRVLAVLPGADAAPVESYVRRLMESGAGSLGTRG